MIIKELIELERFVFEAELHHTLAHTHVVPGARCPRCQKIIDNSAGVGHVAAPTAGDVTVCSPCGAVLEFTDDLSFRFMTDAEVAALPEETLLSLLDGIEAARIMRKALSASTPPRPSSSRRRPS